MLGLLSFRRRAILKHLFVATSAFPVPTGEAEASGPVSATTKWGNCSGQACKDSWQSKRSFDLFSPLARRLEQFCVCCFGFLCFPVVQLAAGSRGPEGRAYGLPSARAAAPEPRMQTCWERMSKKLLLRGSADMGMIRLLRFDQADFANQLSIYAWSSFSQPEPEPNCP